MPYSTRKQCASRGWCGLAFVATSCLATSIRAGDKIPAEPKLGFHRLFHRPSPAETVAVGPAPATAAEVAQQIDHIAESIRNDGLVVLKQPDVFSQARMTKYRREFEEIMAQEKDKFKVILAGRVARVDQASLDSQTSLGAALAPRGSSVTVTPPTTATPPVAPALDGTFADPRFIATTTLGRDDLNLGLEPNSVLDEQKSYLDHLNQIRRVNLGNDIADSAGYGLYLIRLPVSITPGECTVRGHGAETTVTVKHEFPPNFLPATFRNLVINDLVDQLGPPIYEVVRTRVDRELATARLDAEARDLGDQAQGLLDRVTDSIIRAGKAERIRSGRFEGDQPIQAPSFVPAVPPAKGADAAQDGEFGDLIDRISGFVARSAVEPGANPAVTASIAAREMSRRVALLVDEWRSVLDRWRTTPGIGPQESRLYQRTRASIDPWARQIRAQDSTDRRSKVTKVLAEGDEVLVQVMLNLILQDYFFVQAKPDADRLANLLRGLYATALPDDVAILNNACRLGDSAPAIKVAEVNLKLADLRQKQDVSFNELRTLRLPSDRVAKRSYPIAPRELVHFFLKSNLEAIAADIQDGRATENARASDIRSYLRQQLSVAYDIMSRPSARVEPPLAPLDDQMALDEILQAIHNRAFAPTPGGALPLFEIFHRWIARLPDNLEGQSLGALCWAIAVDAALLDEALRDQAAVTFQTAGLPCPDWGSLRFYFVHPDLAGPAAAIFNDYVTNRWPVITFALDPVVDQQNILDEFSLRRDLQLALAFAFSTGQINFNQLITFRRKIQQDEETIALNRTITSFAHGNETFGWRFTPRFQTPPSQGNLATLGSTLLRGGPGPNYALRKSKLEAGQRELVAVVIMPSFLPTIRVESSGNWFRLDDPEHLEVRTKRMIEQGRRVQELRQEVTSACDAARYRSADIRHLRTKIDQLDAMLPIQSRVVALPFDNAPAGFDLFTEGTTALVPELLGFEGAETLVQGHDADLLIFGKFISIHETRVVAGGRELSPRDNVGYEILSREVIRVHLPGTVQPSRSRDGREFVEIYLATPNGISNRLLVPFTRGAASAAGQAPEPIDPDGTVVTTLKATRKQFPPKTSTPPAPTRSSSRSTPTRRVAAADLEPEPQMEDETVDPDPGQVPAPARPTRAAPTRKAARRTDPAPDDPEPDDEAAAPAPAITPPATRPLLSRGRQPNPSGVTPLLDLVDPTLVRTTATGPAAVVTPTPIVVMPPTAPEKPRRRTLLGRAFDHFHPPSPAEVPQVPRP